MPADVIQAQYDQLKSIADRFAKQAEAQKQLQQRITRAMNSLQSGWQGKGSAAFFGEMNGKVLPVMGRLNQAMQQARTTTQELSAIIRQAEEEAARAFRGGQAAQVATNGGAATNGAGGAGGGATTNAGQSTPNVALARNPASLFNGSYMSGMIGQHFKGEGSRELNDLMEKVAQNPRGPEAARMIDRMADIRGVPREQFQAQFQKFLDLRDQAARINPNSPIEMTNVTFHGNFMGSTASLRYGKVVGDAFGIDPVFGSMLNPTGGLVGPDNKAFQPNDHNPVGYHGIFHDAAGYLYNYHNVGPGYDYLGAEPFNKTSNPLTGQVSGIAYWTAKVPAHYANQTASGLKEGVGGLFSGDLSTFGSGMAKAGKGALTTVISASPVVSTVVDVGSTVVRGGVKTVGDWLGF